MKALRHAQERQLTLCYRSVSTATSTKSSSAAPPISRRFSTKPLEDPRSGLKSGVDTPDRFATPYVRPQAALSPDRFLGELDKELEGAAANAPPPAALRRATTHHDGEVGQRDHFYDSAVDLTVAKGHLIPPGRGGEDSGQPSPLATSPAPASSHHHHHPHAQDARTPRAASKSSRSSRSRATGGGDDDRHENKPKAFAFYGQVSPLAL